MPEIISQVLNMFNSFILFLVVFLILQNNGIFKNTIWTLSQFSLVFLIERINLANLKMISA